MLQMLPTKEIPSPNAVFPCILWEEGFGIPLQRLRSN